MIKIACVSYINTFPFLYGLEHSNNSKIFDVRLQIPSKCKESLELGQVDIALLPVVGLHDIPKAQIFSDYCIGCDGPVQTVSIFSNSEISNVRRLYLDTDSLSSVMLVKKLLRNHWHKELEFVSADTHQIKLIDGEAALMIGDKAFKAYHQYKFSYDLGEAWKSFTGMPFVFAVWAADKDCSFEKRALVSEALRTGIRRMDEVIYYYQPQYPNIDLDQYLKSNISFDFNQEKKEAMNVFLESHKIPLPVFT